MRLTHLDSSGRARMVDIGHKPPMRRAAVARGFIRLTPATLRLLRSKGVPKGDALAVAQIAGIQAAKETARLIPLCHTLPLENVAVRFRFGARGIEIEAEARTTARTGVEMEALTAVSVAALAIYDMCKAVDKKMAIGPMRLIRKTKNPLGKKDDSVPGEVDLEFIHGESAVGFHDKSHE
ncbi:MAG: cyclic pyranopterin monophosphate synthase MoaC [Verrucomicrobia bacterium]|nr:cyclic pyranopterin monophosphate synthase MoaC [Verrucomicrobiota bacterium]